MWPCRSGKRLLHTALLQERCKCGGSILLAAVAVKCQIGRGISFAESYPKCTGDQIRAGIAGYAIADDFPGKEVENDAQIKPVIVELEVCNITDPCLIRMFCGKLLLQQVLLAVFLMLFKLLFGIKSNAAQIELLHDRSNALGADSDTTFGQCNANLFGTIPLAAVVESLLYQTHELCLLLVALAAVRTAKDVVVKCTASDIQCFAQLMNTISIIRLMVEIFQNGKSLLQGNICYEPDERKRTFEIVLYCENKGLCDKLFSGDAQQYMLNNKTDAAYRLLCQNDDISVPSYLSLIHI